jgi:hypothetical protein
VEAIPAMPYAGAVWVNGYWGWRGNRHHWIAGRWDGPRVGHRWHPHAWVNLGGRWHLRGGGWVRF